MKFDDKKFEGVFPKRKPWFIILIVIVIIAIPVYLGVLFSGRSRPAGGNGLSSNPSASDSSAGSAVSLSVSAPLTRQPVSMPPVVADGVVSRRREKAVGATRSAGTQAAAQTTGNGGAPAIGMTHEQVGEVLAKGQALEDRGEMLEAGKLYVEAIGSCRDPRHLATLEERLGRANVGLLLSRKTMPGKVAYVVKPNDAVEKIARKFKTTKELVARINGLGSGGVIRNGQSLAVFTGKFSISISKSRYELVLEVDGAFFKRYRVCVGPGAKTPVGSYVITSREINPTWWPEGQGSIPAGDERNLLGTRWMAIKDTQNPASDKRGLGIHGTRDESSIGKAMSHGCIRMLNSDVEELHMLVPIGTPVVIAE